MPEAAAVAHVRRQLLLAHPVAHDVGRIVLIPHTCKVWDWKQKPPFIYNVWWVERKEQFILGQIHCSGGQEILAQVVCLFLFLLLFGMPKMLLLWLPGKMVFDSDHETMRESECKIENSVDLSEAAALETLTEADLNIPGVPTRVGRERQAASTLGTHQVI